MQPHLYRQRSSREGYQPFNPSQNEKKPNDRVTPQGDARPFGFLKALSASQNRSDGDRGDAIAPQATIGLRHGLGNGEAFLDLFKGEFAAFRRQHI